MNDRSPCPFRLQKEVEMNMKKLLTTTFITVFFIIGSAFCAFASENDSSEQTQQTEEAAAFAVMALVLVHRFLK